MKHSVFFPFLISFFFTLSFVECTEWLKEKVQSLAAVICSAGVGEAEILSSASKRERKAVKFAIKDYKFLDYYYAPVENAEVLNESKDLLATIKNLLSTNGPNTSEEVKGLLSTGPKSITYYDILHFCAQSGRLDAVRFLVAELKVLEIPIGGKLKEEKVRKILIDTMYTSQYEVPQYLLERAIVSNHFHLFNYMNILGDYKYGMLVSSKVYKIVSALHKQCSFHSYRECLIRYNRDWMFETQVLIYLTVILSLSIAENNVQRLRYWIDEFSFAKRIKRADYRNLIEVTLTAGKSLNNEAFRSLKNHWNEFFKSDFIREQVRCHVAFYEPMSRVSSDIGQMKLVFSQLQRISVDCSDIDEFLLRKPYNLILTLVVYFPKKIVNSSNMPVLILETDWWSVNYSVI